jgi:hypothetical protein
MEYRVSKVPTLGQGLPIYNVAVSMAYADANDKGGFIESVYKRRLEVHINRLITEAHAGNLEITSRDGMSGTLEQIIYHAPLSGSLLNNIDDPNLTYSLVAFTFLPMLNQWGQRFGYTFVFAKHDSLAILLEGRTPFVLGGNPSLSGTHNELIFTKETFTPNKVIANNPKQKVTQKISNLSPAHTGHMSMALKRKQIIDENKFRGAKRLIIEIWHEVESLHGDTADGHKVLRILKRSNPKLNTELKTIQNLLIILRKDQLIP